MDGYVTIGTKLDTKDFEKEIRYVESQLDEIKDKLDKADMGFDVGDTQKLEMQYEKLSKKLSTLYAKQKQIDTMGFDNLHNSLNKVGNSIKNVVKKVTKWGLAVFGVRSAYLAVRRATSLVSQSNDEIASKLQGVQLFFASAFEPIVEKIVNLIYKLMSYINVIAKAWFGIDLFAKANEKALKGGVKASKEMKKNLAGFDEMNVLQDNSSGGGGASAGLPELEDVKTPQWVEDIANNKDMILGFLKMAGILLVGLKLFEVFSHLNSIFGICEKLSGVFGTILNFIGANALEIGGLIAILGGLSIMIQGIIDYFNNPTWENFIKILVGLGVASAGVALIFGGIPALILLIVGGIIALGVAIYKNWDKIKTTLSVVGTWIYEHIIEPVANFFSNLWTGIKDGVKSAVEWVKEKFRSIVDFFSDLIGKIVGLFKKIGTKVGDAIGGAFKTVINGVLKAIEKILNFPIRSINKLIKVIGKVGIKIPTLPTFNLPRLKTGGIINMPGRGVPVGGMAIGGEAGREGVIPLTDQQAMAELGQEIARNVSINLTDVIQINSRQIGKIMKTIQADDEFAGNW